MTGTDFNHVAKERFEDAKALRAAGRFAGAIYLCGYAIECALKASICQHQQWAEYKLDPDYRLMKTHSFEFLISFSGKEAEIRKNLITEWTVLKEWGPDWRYRTEPTTNTDEIFWATETILKVLL